LIDSLGVMELVMYVQTEYRVAVAPLEVTPENFDSINGVAGYIERKIAALTAVDEEAEAA
jgi:acyl carrier protein